AGRPAFTSPHRKYAAPAFEGSRTAMASAMRRNEKNLPPTQVGSETDMRIGHERPATRGRWNQGHLALLKSAGLPADFIFGPMGIGRFRTEAALKILP